MNVKIRLAIVINVNVTISVSKSCCDETKIDLPVLLTYFIYILTLKNKHCRNQWYFKISMRLTAFKNLTKCAMSVLEMIKIILRLNK